MKKFILSAFTLAVVSMAFAQSGGEPFERMERIDYSALENGTPSSTTHTPKFATVERDEDAPEAITTVPLGASGNAYTIISPHVNSLAYNAATNSVVFIHRTAQQLFPSDDANHGQYRFDVSKDGGATFSVNNGLLNPSGTQSGFASRYPMVSMYNPEGNTNPDSAYMVYFGTYHDGPGGDWNGYWTGRAQLSTMPSTYTENTFIPNSGDVLIAHGLTESTPGTYWAVDFSGNSAAEINGGILVHKGVWDTTAREVNWTMPTTLSLAYDLSFSGTPQATAVNIDFDPTGQYGWISCTGDVTAGGENVLDPIFFWSDDFGDSWNGPIALDLDDIAGLEFDDVNGPASTGFDCGLGVDANGNPHFFTVVLPGSDYSVLGGAPGKKAYDITYDNTFPAACQWRAVLIDTVATFRGDITADVSLDNYCRVSTSPNGEKVFFTWVDSDPLLAGGVNELPNLRVVGLDVMSLTRTGTINITEGDAQFGDRALWPNTATTTMYDGSTYIVPTVLTKLNNALDDLDTTYFHYTNDVAVNDVDFTMPVDNDAPDLTLLGDEEVWSALNSAYNDAGATATDCYDGDLTGAIVVSSDVDTSTIGQYTVTYVVSDAAGNSDTVTRTVFVASAPIVDFDWNFDDQDCEFQFIDQTTSFPQSWVWSFGDASGAVTQNPTHGYATAATFDVTLTATNPIGSGDATKTVQPTCAVGINDPAFAKNISLFPNPSQDFVNVEIALDGTQDVTINVISLLGDRIEETINTKVNGSAMVKIDLTDYASGLYLVEVTANGSTAIKKLTINK